MSSLDVEKIKQKILSKNTSIKEKMRILFYLRNSDDINAIPLIGYFFELKSVLLKHEAGYVLGQMRKKQSIAKLIEVLESNDDEIVRHEAGEALGNFLDKDCVSACYRHLNDANVPVRETCYLATKKFEEYMLSKTKEDATSKDKNNIDENNKGTDQFITKNNDSNFDSYDPAFPFDEKNIDELKVIYLDTNECLYKRYKAMFALRNKKTKEAVDILGEGFCDKSDLFKHEIAFVFGQMRMKESVKYLSKTLDDKTQHGMVRHECAEALGAVGTDDAYEALQKHINDDVDVVRESVEIALDIHEYENNNDDEYAVCTV